MNDGLNGQQVLGGKVFLIILCSALLFSCQNKELTQRTDDNIKFRINELADKIEVTAPRYSLFLDKLSATAKLTDRHSLEYTSFPLDVLFNPNKSVSNTFTKSWLTKGKSIHYTLSRGDVPVREIVLMCDKEYFEIRIRSEIPDGINTGVCLLRNDELSFDTSGWTQYFSPEPDDYQKWNPTVDARVDRDQQWVFTPAPLNLSFKTPAGWFSIGLAELPDALTYAFQNNALWLDYPWKKMILPTDDLFKFPGLIFTFNETPWEAVGQYFERLREEYLTEYKPTELLVETSWWKRPFVSTWGEQLHYNYTFANENFNEEWVKNYIAEQQQALDSLKFTIIIEDKWSRAYGDPYPANRFKNLRKLIDWCHDYGHKVILFWKSWKIEAKSLAIEMEVADGEYVDATSPEFESYVDSCCQVIFGSGPDELNADGLKMDHLFLVRDTETARYSNPSKGIGFKEIHLYLKTFYQRAKHYKPDALIISSAIAPQFADVQDMVRVGNDWDNKLRREKRARIITRALPGKLLCSDAAAMYNKIASYYYVTSTLYGIPTVYYLNQFHDGEIPAETRDIILELLKFSLEKPEGRLRFMDYGYWQIVDHKNEVLTESTISGKGIIEFLSNSRAKLYCVENSDIHFVLERHLLNKVVDDAGNQVKFDDLGHGIYRAQNLQAGKYYKLHIRKIPGLRR